jgi:integrase
VARKASSRLYLRGLIWWAWGYDVNGKIWRESTKQRDKRAAQLAAREIERRYAADSNAARSSKVTLKIAMANLLDLQRKKGRADNTIRATSYHARHLIELLGADRPITTITIADTTSYFERRLEQGGDPHTIHKELIALKQAWKRVAKLAGLQPPPDLKPEEMGQVYKPRERWLPRAEYTALIESLAVTSDRTEELRADYITAWCFTGLRRAELTAYDRERDLDAAKRELKVWGTKTDKAERVVPLANEAFEVFSRRASFPPWTNDRRDLEVACKRAGIAKASPNDFRRTFCSWLCQAGVPERITAELMGHASTAMVRAVYSHFDTASLASAVARISVQDVVQDSMPCTPPGEPLCDSCMRDLP